jgi:hypothetical protein
LIAGVLSSGATAPRADDVDLPGAVQVPGFFGLLTAIDHDGESGRLD